MYCKSCGAKMPDDAKFCVECGQKVEKSTEKETTKESGPKVMPEKVRAQVNPDKKKGGFKKVLFWIFGIIGGLAILFVVLLIVWPSEDQIEKQASRSDFVGVWQALGSAEEPNSGIALYDTTESKIFTIIFDTGRLINVEVSVDGMVLSQAETTYTVSEGHLDCTLERVDASGDIHIRMFINSQGNLVYTEWGTNGAAYEYTVSGLTDVDPEDFFMEEKAGVDQTITPEQEALLTGVEPDIEAIVAGYRWEVSGDVVDAIPDSTLPSGYPRSFEPVQGSMVYTFNTSAKTLTIATYENGQMTNQVTENYTMEEPSTIYAFKRTQSIDGQDYEISSAYFVSNGILYECEVMDDSVCSNFIAYNNIGSSTLTVEDIVAGLNRSFEATAETSLWVVSGESVPVAVNGTLPAGYPRTFETTFGTMVYEFDSATQTLKLSTYDEEGRFIGDYIKHYEMLNSTYASAFKRVQVIDGIEYEVMSVYFISDGVLYECETVDGVDASNYIAYLNMGAAVYSPQAEIDTLVAGLNRDIESALADSRWQINGESLPALPDAALPSGYPRFFQIPAGTMVYQFDTTNRKLTLTVYNEDGTVSDVTTQTYTKINDTYISAFSRTQTLDGVQREVMSVYFISDGVLYECEIVDGIDASNYLAYDRLN
ncbi:MAG: zinc ribbon domain-containing protein [Eubacteriales bacterium]